MIDLKEIKREFEGTAKVILYGASGVGKSSFLNRLVYNKFDIQKSQSIGIEIGTKDFNKGEVSLRVDIWDAYGGPEGATKSTLYLKNALGIG